MRRSRKLRKVVKVTVPREVSKNIKSNINRGNSNQSKISKVTVPVKVNSEKRKWNNIPLSNAKYSNVPKIWANETVYLIGGGPSLKNFNWNLLNGKKTIAINKSIKFYPNADVVYWTDGRFHDWFKDEISKFKGLKYTITPRRDFKDDINLLKRGVKFGLETATNALAHGNNSGYAAINLAIHLGAKKIILLGYDMSNNGKESHFHDGYKVNATSEKIYTTHFLQGFSVLKESIKGMNIKILNASPTSRLNTFPIITIEEALSLR